MREEAQVARAILRLPLQRAEPETQLCETLRAVLLRERADDVFEHRCASCERVEELRPCAQRFGRRARDELRARVQLCAQVLDADDLCALAHRAELRGL